LWLCLLQLDAWAHVGSVSFDYRSLRDDNRSMSAMPRKRRLAVKVSSVAMGQSTRPDTALELIAAHC